MTVGIGGILSSIHDPAIICQSVSLFSYSNNTLEQSSQEYLSMGKPYKKKSDNLKNQIILNSSLSIFDSFLFLIKLKIISPAS